MLDIVPACQGGANGGTSVKIGVREPNSGPMIGWVAYVHLANVRVQKGQTVYPDTVLGQVGDGFPVNDACWDGPHVHLAGYNYHQYSCYADPASVAPGDTLGRVGGSDVTAPRTRCP